MLSTRDLLRNITQSKSNTGRYATIKSVNKIDLTCVVTLLDNTDIDLFDVKISASPNSTNYVIPKVSSLVIVDSLNDDSYYVALFSEIDNYYQATGTESILDVMLDFLKAIKAIQLTHPQGPTTTNGVINLSDFIDIENRLKKFYLK